MDFTARMTALLGEMRRERNGAVADAMFAYGRPFGLNFGVSIPTLRRAARAEFPDHDFARYLYQQDVRELRLAALHVAQPERLTIEELPVWASGIVNSEVAEEAAFALLCRTEILPDIFSLWIAGSNPLLQYAALMASARSQHLSPDFIAPALAALRRCDTQPDDYTAQSPSAPDTSSVPATPAEKSLPFPDRLIAQGVVALFAGLAAQNEESRQAVIRATCSLGSSPSEDFVHEELAWRLEA